MEAELLQRDSGQRSSEGSAGLVREVLRIAAPVGLNWCFISIASMLVLFLLSMQDDELGMASLGLASVLVNVTGRTLLWGLGSALDTFASQAWGAKEYKTIGVFGQRALLVLTLTVNVPLALLWLNAEKVLNSLGQEADVSAQSAMYARIRLPGQFAAAVVCVLQKVMISIRETRLLVITDVLNAVANFFLTLGLMMGLGLGLKGAAIASSASDILNAVILVVAVLQNSNCRKCWGGWTSECWSGWPQYLQLAVPALLMVMCEEWCA